jgi:hypothetical protein
MVVLVDEEGNMPNGSGRRFRHAPPVSNNIGGKEWDPRGMARERGRDEDKRNLNTYDAHVDRRGNRNDTLNRKNSAINDGSGRPTSSRSAYKHSGVEGDVSEFSFQLK